MGSAQSLWKERRRLQPQRGGWGGASAVHASVTHEGEGGGMAGFNTGFKFKLQYGCMVQTAIRVLCSNCNTAPTPWTQPPPIPRIPLLSSQPPTILNPRPPPPGQAATVFVQAAPPPPSARRSSEALQVAPPSSQNCELGMGEGS